MEKPFTIQFDFPVAHSTFTVTLNATAELHHSDPYYVVHSFQYSDGNHPNASVSVLPSQEIKRIRKDGKLTWVHKDSERESLLSLALGKAIEQSIPPDEIE